MKMWLLSILLPGLLLTTNACSPTDEPVKTEEPPPARLRDNRPAVA